MILSDRSRNGSGYIQKNKMLNIKNYQEGFVRFFEEDFSTRLKVLKIAKMQSFSTWLTKIVYIFIHLFMWKTSGSETLKFQR
jgi:hypothetical protein